MDHRSFHTDLFKESLKTKWLGQSFRFFDEIGSTNSYLKNLPESELHHGEVVLADLQKEGRGQHQKQWNSDSGKNLTFSIVFKPNRADRFTLLTLSIAYAVLQVLQKYTDESLKLKWPNDLYAGSKKMGGILTECTFLGSRPERVVIGIGLNILQEGFPDSIKDIAISLKQISEKKFTREQILSECLNACEHAYELWESSEQNLHKLISRTMIGFGEWVRLSIDNRLMDERYKFLGVNEKGELLVLNEKLELNTYSHEQVRIITGNESISKIH